METKNSKFIDNLVLSTGLKEKLGKDIYARLNKEAWQDAFLDGLMKELYSRQFQELLPQLRGTLDEACRKLLKLQIQFPLGYVLINKTFEESTLSTDDWLARGLAMLLCLPSPSTTGKQVGDLNYLYVGKTTGNKRHVAYSKFVFTALNILGGNTTRNGKLLYQIIFEQCKQDDFLKSNAKVLMETRDNERAIRQLRSTYDRYSKWLSTVQQFDEGSLETCT